MAKKWSEITKDKRFKQLSPKDQADLKRDYFKEVIAQDDRFKNLSDEEKTSIGKDFFKTELKGKSL